MAPSAEEVEIEAGKIQIPEHQAKIENARNMAAPVEELEDLEKDYFQARKDLARKRLENKKGD